MISSTARDLPEHRAAAQRACQELGVRPEMMEDLTARPGDAVTVSRQMVAGSDLFIGIYRWRYGYVPDAGGPSVTETEYECAKDLGIPRLMFVSGPDDDLVRADDVDPATWERLKALRGKVLAEQVCRFFDSPDELYEEVARTLEWAWSEGPLAAPRPGGADRPAGPHFGVPALGPAHLSRGSDLERVRRALMGRAGGIVAITAAADVPAQGLGKAVLAAGAAHDRLVRGRFPDGIHWLDLHSGDAKAAMNTLAAQLGVDGFERAPGEDRRRALLADALRDRATLLILNHVRSPGVVQALSLVGPRGRILCTADDRAVLEHQSARLIELEPLSDDAAEELLRTAAGVGDRWPEGSCTAADIARILELAGGQPFALAALGAVLRAGRLTPGALADDLAREHARLPSPADAVDYRVLRVALGSLAGPEAGADAERFRRLAVFPDREPIPCAELARLWELSHDETWAAAGRLEDVDVVERRDGAVRVPFKRSLLLIDAVDVARLHDVLVRAYRDLCATPGDWATLPADERHAWDHLVFLSLIHI